MTVSAPLLTRRAVLQLAIEGTYGTAASVGANDAIYVESPDYQVNVNLLQRDFTRDDISPLAGIVGRREASMKFTTELKGNGLQNSGNTSNAPILARLFEACGYELSGSTTPSILGPLSLGDEANMVTWASSASAATNTDVIYYELDVTTGGASGTAEITVTSDTMGESSAAAIVTTGTPISLGTKGATVTPTFTGSLVVGQRWGLWLLPAGLMLQPISDNFQSLTLVLNMDGVQHTMTGSFGTFTVTAEAGNFAKIEWEFKGKFLEAVDAALPTCNYDTTLPHQVELARLRVDDDYVIVQTMTFNQQNDVQIRPDVSSAEGYVGTRIVSRKPEGGINPEAELVANHDFWGKLGSAERMPFQMRVGVDPGNTVWMFAPSTQYTGLTYQDRNGIRAYDAKLMFSRVNGNDESFFFFC
jgi:hypothetical protein